jgi:iron complex outermembrane receptor protein
MRKQAWMVAALTGTALAMAQEPGTTNQTEVVVTATREWTETSRVPVSMSVITSGEIERKGANNLSDVLRDVPGVYIRSLSGGPIAETSMRGGGENSQGRVLVLLDGRRLNNPDMASMNWLQIPLNQVERVEVLRGSQSALYGDFASQGVINIITKKGSAQTHSELSVIGGSFDTYITRAGVSGTGLEPLPLSYAANAEWQTSDGYRDNSGYDASGAGGRLGYDFNDNAGMALAGSWYRSDYELPGDLTLQEMKDDPKQSHNPDDSSDNEYVNMGLDLFSQPSDRVRLDAGLGWQGKETDTDVNSWFMFSESDLHSYSAQPRVTLDSDWLGKSQRTTLGVDAYLDQLKVDRFSDPDHDVKTIAADLDKETIGAYVRHQVELTSKWIVNAGGRVEQAEYSVDADSFGAQVLDDSTTHHAESLEGGLTYAFEPGSKVFTRIGTVYRFPFVDEQISYYGFGSDTFYQELDPEKGLNSEVGIELGLNRQARVGATLFRLDMEDEVAWDPIENRNANLDETTRQGVELFAQWKPLSCLELASSYTYTDAEFTSGPNDGKDIPLVPPQLATGSVILGLPADLFFDTTIRYADSSPLGGDVANEGDELDSYYTLDLKVRYRPAGKPYSAFVGVENVTDEEYATVAYKGFMEDGYYPSPGQNWRAGVSLTF